MNKIILSNKIDEILSAGVSLESIGVKNWALPQEKALQALDQFVKLQVPVLGGDVCELMNGVVQYNYDNWYCDEIANESNFDFVKRSVEKARKYIENYDIEGDSEIFFAFVLKT